MEDCLAEIERLQQNLKQKTSRLDQLQSRLDGEQELSRELRIENTRLKSDMHSLKTDSDSKDEKIEDLRAHIRRYVTEVKRIEELLAIREKERIEILDSYKHLNDENESSVNYGRRLESKVSYTHYENFVKPTFILYVYVEFTKELISRNVSLVTVSFLFFFHI